MNNLAIQNEYQRLAGRQVIPADLCQYQNISAEDLLLVNFDAAAVDRDGYFLLERIERGKVSWMGCRRFEVRLGSIFVDETGNGDMTLYTDDMARSFRVSGRVERIYKPAKL